MIAKRTRHIWSAIAAATALWYAFSPARVVRAVTFEFLYADPGGVGFFDPVTGLDRRTAVEYAGSLWGSLIPSAYAGETITVIVSYAELGTQTRAATPPGYLYPAPTRPDTHFPKALANHLSGTDVDPDKAEISIQFNSNPAFGGAYWYYGIDGNPSAAETDYVSTAFHEIGHGLGFSSSLRQNGSYGLFGDGLFNPDVVESGLPTIYDQFLTLGPNGTRLLDLPQNQRVAALVSSNVFWNGVQATAANGGTPVEIWAPNPYQMGSSTSHVDHTIDATTASAIMQAARPTGKAIHAPLTFERAMMRDMGWNIAVTPSSLFWSGEGADNSWTTPGNWALDAPPRGGDTVSFGPSPQTDVAVRYDGGFAFFESLNLQVGAPAYTLRFKAQTETKITGAGILNFSSQPLTIFLESSLRDDLTSDHTAAKLTFTGPVGMAGANAGNAGYHLRGGGTTIGGIAPPHGTYFFDRHAGASVTFEMSSTAGTADFEIEGGSGDGGPNALVTFRGNSSASGAEFRTKSGRLGPSLPLGSVAVGFGGQVLFEDKAEAGSATFHNEGQADAANGGGGFTIFTDDSTAEGAEIHNHGATYLTGYGGATYFEDHSNAGSAMIINHADGSNHVNYTAQARTIFVDDANGGMATIENEGAPSQSQRPGRTEFHNNASAGGATINNRGYRTVGDLAGRTLFYDDTTAATATLNTFNGYSDHGRIEFHDRSTAANAHIFLERDPMVTASLGGYLLFYDNTTAAKSEITLRAGNSGFSGLQFYNNAAAADAQVVAEDSGGSIVFWGNSTAGDPPGADTPEWANFSLGQGVVMSFYDQSTADDAHFTLADRAQIFFQNSSSAGHAQIAAAGGSVYTASPGATITFNSNSTADNATILITGATAPLASPAAVWFINGAHAGNSTLIASGGTGGGSGATITFTSGAKGDTARLVANAGGTFDFAQQFAGGTTTVGSINGAGTFYLRGTELVVGTRDEDSTVTGQIVDTLLSPTYTGGRLTKVGTRTLTLAGANTYSGVTTVNGGTLRVDGSLAGPVVVNNGGTLIGDSGNIPAGIALNAGGVWSPGASPGTMTIGGLTMNAGSTLNFELGASDRDHIVLTGDGNVVLDGILNLSLLDGFMPTPGQSFALFEGAVGSITGAFDVINGPLFNGLTFDVLQNASSVMLQVVESDFLPGDFNHDGVVNGADLTNWQTGFGASGFATHAQGDADGDAAVDGADFLAWQRQLGAVTPEAAAVGSAPEPGTLPLLAISVLGLAVRARRRRLRSADARFRPCGP